MRKLLLCLLFVGILFSPSFAGDISKAHSYINGEVLTATLLNASFDEIILEVNDIDGDNLATNIAIVTTGICRFANKIALTQSDNNEYIDSLADGYVDVEATTGIRSRINGTEQINLVDGILQPTTDNDVDLGASGKEYKNLYIDGTANIDALVADTADINAGTWQGSIDGNWTASGQTCADLGAVTTTGAISTGAKLTLGANEIEGSNFDINGGNADGLTLGASSACTVNDLTMTLGSDADGDIYYRASNVLTRLAKGTVGEVLLMNSGATAPEWGLPPAISFVSRTVLSNSANSGDLAISQDIRYMIRWTLFSHTGSSSPVIEFVFNSDNTANYAELGGDTDLTDSDSIAICAAIDNVNGFCMGELTIDTFNTDMMIVRGHSIFNDTGGIVTRKEISAYWDKSEALSSFEFFSSQAMAGDVIVYKLNET